MSFTIQTFYPPAGLFLDTNHESDDLDSLKVLTKTDTFIGFRLRIVDDAGNTAYEPPAQERADDLSVQDVASMLGVPVIGMDELDDYLGQDDDDE